MARLPETQSGDPDLKAIQNLADELEAIAKHCAGLPVLDGRSADEILGIGEDGLPSARSGRIG